MKFFLIILIFGQGSTIEHIEFLNYKSCDIARVAVMAAPAADSRVSAFCVPVGQP